jgi:hypothetical protein
MLARFEPVLRERGAAAYHFTIGGPVEDPRLRTVAPYAHLD